MRAWLLDISLTESVVLYYLFDVLDEFCALFFNLAEFFHVIVDLEFVV
jgi:hypothetical protein